MSFERRFPLARPRDMRGDGATGRGFSIRENDWLRDVLNVEARNSPILEPEDVADRFILQPVRLIL